MCSVHVSSMNVRVKCLLCCWFKQVGQMVWACTWVLVALVSLATPIYNSLHDRLTNPSTYTNWSRDLYVHEKLVSPNP